MFEPVRDKDVLFFSRLHWIIFFWPIAALCAALAIVSFFDSFSQVGYGFALLALVWAIITWFRYFFSSITIKNNQVVLRTGILVRTTINIPINKIEAIDIRQSIIGSLFGYGLMSITGTGGTRRIINFLHSPLTCRRYIEQLIGELHEKNG